MNKATVLNTFLQNNSLDMLLEAVSVQLGCPVIVTDNAFHIVSSFAAKGFEDEAYRKAVAHSELPLSACGEIAKGFEESGGERILAETNGKSFSVNVLKSGCLALGYIIYILFEAELPPEQDCLFCESLVAKQFYTDRHTSGFAVSSAEEIIVELLDGKFPNAEVFKMKAAGTFLSAFNPERFALIELSGNSADKLKNEHIARSLEQSFNASHPVFYGGKMLLFLHEDHDIRFLNSVINEYRLRAVISERLENLFALKNEYEKVNDVLSYLKNKKAPFLERSRDYKLLMLLKKSGESFGFLEKKVKNAFEYDKENDGELCLTLYTYLICRHSLSETGERLFTHRNTVQYRLKKLREDFEIDPDSPDGQLALLLSLSRALLLLGNEKLFIQNGEF